MQSTHFINGEWVAGQGHDIRSIDPAKNTVIWEAKSASAEQVDAAIRAARQASVQWAAKTVDERLDIIKAFGAQLEQPLYAATGCVGLTPTCIAHHHRFQPHRADLAPTP